MFSSLQDRLTLHWPASIPVLLGLALVLNLSKASSTEPVCKVVDGDTFHFCDGVKIRLNGIDAPEHGEPFYWQSRRALAAALQGKEIKTLNCKTDSTGRRQACLVLVDGQDIQASLVRQGMAWDWPKYSNGRYSAEELAAKTAKTGLWSNPEATSTHWSKRTR